MDSSQIFGGTEECHSSESGWTMYIGSPIHGGDDDDGTSDDDDHDDQHRNEDSDHNGDYNATHNDDSDDSMASDASSGPSHREHSNWDDEYGHGMACFKKDEVKEKHSSKKKPTNSVGKQRAERRKEEKEEKILLPKRAKAPVQSGAKVRRNNWLGKRT